MKQYAYHLLTLDLVEEVIINLILIRVELKEWYSLVRLLKGAPLWRLSIRCISNWSLLIIIIKYK